MRSKLANLCFGFLLIILWNAHSALANESYPRALDGGYDRNGWAARNTLVSEPNAFSADVRVLKQRATSDLTRLQDEIDQLTPRLGRIRSLYESAERAVLTDHVSARAVSLVRQIARDVGSLRALSSVYARVLASLVPDPHQLEPWYMEALSHPQYLDMSADACPVPRVDNYRIYWWPGDSAVGFLRDLRALNPHLPALADELTRALESQRTAEEGARQSMRSLRALLGNDVTLRMRTYLELADQEVAGLEHLSTTYGKAVQDKIDLERAKRSLASINENVANMTSATVRRCAQVYAGMQGRDTVPLLSSGGADGSASGNAPVSGGAGMDLTGENDPYGLVPAWAPTPRQ
jgi:hypothetical protein